MAVKLSRQEYCEMFGPTVGDKIHLADTGLIAEIEKDYAADCYGDEILFGGGKTDRDGMGNMSGKTTEDGVLDVCVTNAIIIDPMLASSKETSGLKTERLLVSERRETRILEYYTGLDYRVCHRSRVRGRAYGYAGRH